MKEILTITLLTFVLFYTFLLFRRYYLSKNLFKLYKELHRLESLKTFGFMTVDKYNYQKNINEIVWIETRIKQVESEIKSLESSIFKLK